jgi:hypothetical protein
VEVDVDLAVSVSLGFSVEVDVDLTILDSVKVDVGLLVVFVEYAVTLVVLLVLFTYMEDDTECMVADFVVTCGAGLYPTNVSAYTTCLPLDKVAGAFLVDVDPLAAACVTEGFALEDDA